MYIHAVSSTLGTCTDHNKQALCVPCLCCSFLLLASCLACGKFIQCFPEECLQFMEELFPLFVGNLEDSIPSIRQGAAAAIASVVTAYGEY